MYIYLFNPRSNYVPKNFVTVIAHSAYTRILKIQLQFTKYADLIHRIQLLPPSHVTLLIK